ncbi:signal peptidase I [Clostridium sp.]|uniref:signal peptidase I n=1 Tax=Clostridium sp. TaxID=1506 RepID=UPI002FCCA0FB
MEVMNKFIKEWAIPILCAIILAFLINKFMFFNVSVPTESMYPTIKPGDKIFVLRNYKPSSLKRGDILVFHSEEANEDLIKRLVGLPNEKVEVKSDGSVLINGEKLDEPYVKYKSDKVGTFLVPEGHYLFLGDNRSNSVDSRYWENPYIPYDEIMGKAKFIIKPFDRFGSFK